MKGKIFLAREGFVTIILVLFFTTAWAVEWTYTGETNEGTKHYYDMDSYFQNLKSVKKDSFRIWSKQVSSDGSYLVAFQEVDCREMKMELLQLLNYDKNGEILGVERFSDNWRYIVPGSSAEEVFKYLCKERMKNLK